MPSIKVRVLEANMGDIVGTIKGEVEVDGRVYSFTGTAFGRYGGQNIHVKLSSAARASLRRRGYNFEEIEVAVQEAIVRGSFSQLST